MKMCCKQCKALLSKASKPSHVKHKDCARRPDDLFSNRPSEAKAVECARAAAEFIDDDERIRGRIVEYALAVDHFGHKRRNT